MSTSASDLRAIALAEFAGAGYTGTSLQRIADRAGLSKSAVLYHYASKEVLLEEAIAPAIDELDAMLAELLAGQPGQAARRDFVEAFTDFLLRRRLEVHMFINQGPSLVDVPVIDRANDLVRRMAAFFESTTASVQDRMRFGIALGGAAYTLCMEGSFGLDPAPEHETRDALVSIMTELLAPMAMPLSTVPAAQNAASTAAPAGR